MISGMRKPNLNTLQYWGVRESHVRRGDRYLVELTDYNPYLRWSRLNFEHGTKKSEQDHRGHSSRTLALLMISQWSLCTSRTSQALSRFGVQLRGNCVTCDMRIRSFYE